MINELFESLSIVRDTFEDMGTAWALVGGLAVSCYVDPRFTRDIDVAVAVKNDADAESFLHAWQSRGYVLSAVMEQDAVGGYPQRARHASAARSGSMSTCSLPRPASKWKLLSKLRR
ncbi:nucleotidyl transferase AbiEii/AbiGii toxin family protein [Lujinxingia vulgaris]|uniref:Nucleotidyl transferase AbiEii/AbiGii toxin family protein n=1 Tax=Lujinxingia vulgaris TaxID=2600176 RepID=A0A5C6X4J2_9DELT|nr:nucleotidyl transferase AbiEii/AbiGii toxin family protein [Lujinxingia vulgaris]